MPFGGSIKKLREGANISVQKIADRIGVDAERWRKWEQNDQNPRVEDSIIIERFFGMDLNKIVALPSIKKFLIVPRELSEVPIFQDDQEGKGAGSKPDPMAIIADLTKSFHSLVDQQKELVNNNSELVKTNRDLVNKVINSDATGKVSAPEYRSGKGKRPDIAVAPLSGRKAVVQKVKRKDISKSVHK